VEIASIITPASGGLPHSNPANATLTKADGPARYQSGSFRNLIVESRFDRRIRRIRLKHSLSLDLA
jgi:hypothetical protein